MPTVLVLDCPHLTLEQTCLASRRFLDALYAGLGGEVQAARAHSDYRRVDAKYDPREVPSDVDAQERATIDRWDGAYDLAVTAAFGLWPHLNHGASFEILFLPTYKARLLWGPLFGFAVDGARRSLACRDYVVEYARDVFLRGGGKGHVHFRGADVDGHDLVVDLREYPELLAVFVDGVRNTQLEVTEQLY